MTSGGADPLADMTPEQRDTVRNNILMGEVVLDTLIPAIVAHLIQTENKCPLGCIGQASEAVDGFVDGQLRILLIQALRRLAAIEWEKAQ